MLRLISVTGRLRYFAAVTLVVCAAIVYLAPTSTKTKASYTNWLANPAITCVGGGYQPEANGQFINPFEMSVIDLGFDVAFIGYRDIPCCGYVAGPRSASRIVRY
jgi:hypothetical protein